jgi:hypothetical protein
LPQTTNVNDLPDSLKAEIEAIDQETQRLQREGEDLKNRAAKILEIAKYKANAWDRGSTASRW